MGTEILPKTEEAASAEAPSSVELQIIRQIEYYFGNYNLSRDKFLREQLKLDDGWVPLETMVKFNRLKKLSEDFDVITAALKKSPKQMMEISDDCTKIRRKNVELPEEISKRHDELDQRTVYVKGFKKNNTLDELLDFFKEYNVEHVYMRRRPLQNKTSVFKGSVFATFENKEEAAKFLETKGIKYSGTELLKEWKVDYIKKKDEFYKNLKEEKDKKALEKGKVGKKEQENGEKAKQVKGIEMIPGCLLKLSNLDENTTREDIKSVFEPYGDIVYVDYSRGKPEAVLRFETAVAKSIFEKVTEDSNKFKIGSRVPEICLIEGEDEEKYWDNIAISRAQTRQKFKGHGHRGKRMWPRQKRKNDNNERDDESTEPSSKKFKVDQSEGKTEKESAMQVSSETVKVETDSKSENESTEPSSKKFKVDQSEGKTEKESAMQVSSETVKVETDSKSES